MIGLAGVSFSITIVALSLASSQFGSRLLRNFTRDRRNHLVLGVLLGAFIYCITMLVTVRGTDDDEEFRAPLVGVVVAFGMALGGLAAFVFFVHHVAREIQATHVIATVARELDHAIDQFFPEEPDEACRMPVDGWLAQRPGHWQASPIGAPATGHVQALDLEDLIALACEHDGVVEVLVHAGTFVNAGGVIQRFHGEGPVDARLRARLSECCFIGRERTLVQDYEFAIHQLVEVAGRAMSTGLNDTFTAITAADHLGAAYARIGGRGLPNNVFRDDDGEIRLLLPLVTFGDVFAAGMNQLRQHARTTPAVSIRLLDMLVRLLPHLQRAEDRQVVAAHARAIASGAEEAAPEPLDQHAIRQRLALFEDDLSRLAQSAPDA
jgi:uncharacterized membrane protein